MIPTALTSRETDLLSLLAQGKRVYEAGALFGHSTLALASTARSVVSVDPHYGYPRKNPSPTWDIYQWNLQRAGATNVTPIRGIFQDNPPVNVDMAWADLTGQYELTQSFLLYTHKIPLVLIHDYARSSCDGATRAVDEYIKENGLFHVFRVDTLIVLQK